MLLHLKLNNFQLKYIEKTGRKLEVLAALRIDSSGYKFKKNEMRLIRKSISMTAISTRKEITQFN